MSLNCIACSGRYASGYGYSSCKDCPAGKYASSSGSTGCSNCSPGYYTPSSGDKSCKNTANQCPTGSYCLGNGHVCASFVFVSTSVVLKFFSLISRTFTLAPPESTLIRSSNRLARTVRQESIRRAPARQLAPTAQLVRRQSFSYRYFTNIADPRLVFTTGKYTFDGESSCDDSGDKCTKGYYCEGGGKVLIIAKGAILLV